MAALRSCAAAHALPDGCCPVRHALLRLEMAGWGWGVAPKKWIPSHHLAAHHFDKQPPAAYLPGLIIVCLVFSYNVRRQQQSQQQQHDEPAETSED
jgi:hypothetical protein|eukprot:COSAG01_NODE_4558_length_4922_cov_11.336720_2_plen_96_part_00